MRLRIWAVLLLLLCSAIANQEDDKDDGNPEDIPRTEPGRKGPPMPHPHVKPKRWSVRCNVGPADLKELFRDNLEPDVRRWRARAPLNMTALYKLYDLNPDNDVRRLVLIYNNTFYMVHEPKPRVCADPCNRYMEDVASAFQHWMEKRRIAFPNVLFHLSVHDSHHCYADDSCPAPMLSIAKIINHRNPKAFPEGQDILIPKAPRRKLAWQFEFPWELKSDKAVWRGTRWCDWGTYQYHTNCSRFYTGYAFNSSKDFQEVLDFGFTAGDDIDGPILPLVPYISTGDYTRFKFILNLDGFTAAYRLSKIMLLNSVVLKEESFRGEYYYRSLKEWEHYIPIYKDNGTDLVDVVREYRQPHRLPDLQRISKNANAFAAKYCCPRARMLYWQRVLVEFKKLFPDMDAEIEARWWPYVQSKLDGTWVAPPPSPSPSPEPPAGPARRLL